MINLEPATNFIRESNRIEGINRAPTPAEIAEYQRFMALGKITIEELEKFVSVYQPNASLRRYLGQNVRVGSHVAPPGGPDIVAGLQATLDDMHIVGAWETHVRYEMLHPFMDGNGRSGRMLWMWQMRGRAPLGFLHTFYYQTLDAARK